MLRPVVVLVSALTSLVQFPGHGGPGGNFDWVIGNDFPPPPYETFVLDTTYSVIVDATQTQTETVIRGRVDVRNLTIKANGILDVEGPCGLFLTATGTIRIDGRILARGANNLSVATLNTTGISEPGAAGGPGGGRGGTGNARTHESTAKGEDGYGAFDTVRAGGGGGESGYQPGFPLDLDDAHRRPAGGGGGAFGHPFLRPAGIVSGYTNPNECPDQGAIGFDAEAGFSGFPGDTRSSGAVGVVTGATPPRGGSAGPGPFTDGDPTNDFWGKMATAGGAVIDGELQRPWAGAGGGGGGNAIESSTFPTTPFDPTGDEKGSGGGGGGGSVTIMALGSIEFGPAGRIDASGGTGGGGENSSSSGGLTHIGGGSGGGSGGHVILESSTRIDFSECLSTSNPPAGIHALGGQGGAGKDNLGGSTPGGITTPPSVDALPPDSYPSASAPCAVVAGQAGYAHTNTVGDNSDAPYVVICAGGDGGPGIVQLHTPSPSDVIPPQNPGENIYKIIQPPPVSSLPATGVPSYRTINDPRRWNTMLVGWGMRSQAVSTWTRAAQDPRQFALPAILGAGRSSGADRRRIAIDPDSVEDLYLRYPSILAGAEIRIGSGRNVEECRVSEATRDEDTNEIRLRLDPFEDPVDVPPGTPIEIRPRLPADFARSIDAKLPHALRALVELQTAPAASGGGPDLSRASAWSAAFGEARPHRGFLHLRVSIVSREEPSDAVEPIPASTTDFFRVRFGF